MADGREQSPHLTPMSVLPGTRGQRLSDSGRAGGRPNSSPLQASYSYTLHPQKGRYSNSRLTNRPPSPFSGQMPRPSSAMSGYSTPPLGRKAGTMPPLGSFSAHSTPSKRGKHTEVPSITKEDIQEIASKSTKTETLPLRAWASVPDIHSDHGRKRRAIPHLKTDLRSKIYTGMDDSPEVDEFGEEISPMPETKFPGVGSGGGAAGAGGGGMAGRPPLPTVGSLEELASPPAPTGFRKPKKKEKTADEILEEEMSVLGRELEEDAQAQAHMAEQYKRYKDSQEGLNEVRNDLDNRRATLKQLKEELTVLKGDTPVDRPMFNPKKELMDRPVHDRLVQLERAVHQQERLRDEAIIYTQTLTTVIKRMMVDFKNGHRDIEKLKEDMRMHEDDEKQLWKMCVDSENERRDSMAKRGLHEDALKRQQAIQRAQSTKMKEELKNIRKEKKYEEERRLKEIKISQDAAESYYWEKYGSKEKRNMQSMLKMRLNEVGAKGKESSIAHIQEMEGKYRKLLSVAGVERVEDVISKYLEVAGTKDALEEKGRKVEGRIAEAEAERGKVIQELEMLSFRRHDKMNVNKVMDEYDRKLITMDAHGAEVEEKFRRCMVFSANVAIALHYFVSRVMLSLPPADHPALYPAGFDAHAYLEEMRGYEAQVDMLVESDLAVAMLLTSNLMRETPGSKENVWDLVEAVQVHGSEGRILTAAAPQLEKMHGQLTAAKLIKAATGGLPVETREGVHREESSSALGSGAARWKKGVPDVSAADAIDTTDPLEVRRSALRLTAIQRLLLQKRMLGGDLDEDASGALSPGSSWMRELYQHNMRLVPVRHDDKDVSTQETSLKEAALRAKEKGKDPREALRKFSNKDKSAAAEEEEEDVKDREEVKNEQIKQLRLAYRDLLHALPENDVMVLPAEQIEALKNVKGFDPSKFEVARDLGKNRIK